MSDIQYLGERLFFGQVGHFMIVLNFTAALIGAIAFFYSLSPGLNEGERSNLLKTGRWSFVSHASAVFVIIGLIFYLMYIKAYEYYYVWQHVSDDLPLKYMLSAFWEGQEGSFLLWLFWHAVLGLILLKTERKYQAAVLGTLSIVQLVLASMLLGIYIGDTRIGINPFVLLRDEIQAPIFATADYLQNITGSGLNPLLQNYWMTIHPPTLFLGFASMTIPFCYAVAGWYSKDHKAWLKPVLPWALNAGFFLGTGILMGGAWAYEALTFGGYWAWDPVENMSLVPWLILVAGIHTNFIANATGQAIRSTYIFYWLAFVLIIYSTFLTRSGILGDTSAHAFTEMGLEWHLVLFVLLFALWGLFEILRHWKSIPVPEKEEKSLSREFWMFIGSLTLLFSGILISFTTSIPVYNKIFDLIGYFSGQNMASWHRTSPTDVVDHYNKYQIWIGIFITFLSSLALFLRYRMAPEGTTLRRFASILGIIFGLSLLSTLLTAGQLNANAWQFKLFLFSGFLGVFANLILLLTSVRKSTAILASASSHFGFGLLLLGIISTGLNKTFISTNRFAQEGLLDNQTEKGLGQNITLLKGVPMLMSGYEVTYTGDTLSGIYREFDIVFKKYGSDGNFTDSFTVNPNILYDRSFTKVAASNPSTKRYLSKDIFTHIHSLPPEQVNIELAKEKEDSLQYESYDLFLGDTLFLSDGVYGVLSYLGRNTMHPEYTQDSSDYLGSVQIIFKKLEEEGTHIASPFIIYEDGMLVNFPHQVNPYRLKVRLADDNFIELFNFNSEDRIEQVLLGLNGGKAEWENYDITLESIQPGAIHPMYTSEKEDLSLNAILKLTDKVSGKAFVLKPAYVIRQNKVITYDFFSEETGILIGIQRIDPENEVIVLKIAHKDLTKIPVRLDVAEKSGRTDFIVLEAIVFPGINMVWAGCILMLIGFVLSIKFRFFNGKRV